MAVPEKGKRKANGVKITPPSLFNSSLQLRFSFSHLDRGVILLQHDSLKEVSFDILLTQAHTENVWWASGLEVSRRITRHRGEARDLR